MPLPCLTVVKRARTTLAWSVAGTPVPASMTSTRHGDYRNRADRQLCRLLAGGDFAVAQGIVQQIG